MSIRQLTVGAVLAGVACSTVQRVQPAQFIPKYRPTVVTVTSTDSEETKVLHPQIDGDTLRGTVAGLGERVALPLEGIVNTWAMAPNPRLTAFVIAGGILVGGLSAYVIANRGSAGVSATCPPDAEAEEC